VYALDAVYGDLKWKSEAFAGDRLWTTPVVDGDKIYVSSFDGCLYVLSAEDGQLLPWRFEAESGFASSPAVYDGLVFIGSFDRNLYALRLGSDEPVWKLAGGNWFWAPPVVSDGIVYAGCTDGLLYAVDAASGQEIWPQPFATSGSIVASPLLVDNVLVVACDSGDLYLVDVKTGSGERIGNPQFPGSTDRPTIEAAVLSSLWVQDDNIAYIHAQNDRLYALDIASREVKEVLSFRED
jgi:outer membrane protein assembly factor BamB